MRERKAYAVTITLVGINILAFLILSIWGDPEDPLFMLEHGAVYGPLVLEEGQWYRLFTALFLHFGFYHLMNNMVILGALGSQLEPVVGSLRLLAIYLVSGLGGNLLSLGMNAWRGEVQAVSAGASGAIFGLMGTLVWILLRNRGRVGRLQRQRVLLMVGLSLYFGFSSTGVDNAAHVGGLLAGFLAAMALDLSGRGGRGFRYL